MAGWLFSIRDHKSYSPRGWPGRHMYSQQGAAISVLEVAAKVSLTVSQQRGSVQGMERPTGWVSG